MIARRIAGLVALAAFLGWGWLGWRALTGPETWAAADERTGCFVVTVGAAFVAWPYRRADPEEEETL